MPCRRVALAPPLPAPCPSPPATSSSPSVAPPARPPHSTFTPSCASGSAPRTHPTWPGAPQCSPSSRSPPPPPSRSSPTSTATYSGPTYSPSPRWPHRSSAPTRSSPRPPPTNCSIKYPAPPATPVLNVMLASLCRSSDLDSARAFFDDIPDKDVVSWSTVLACYFSRGRLADGLAFFRSVTFTSDIAVDGVMLTTLLTACTSAGLLLPFCRAIHGYGVRRTIPPSMHLGTALIDCYAKANRLDYATRVFALVPNRNVMHWTTMICGMASHLRNKEAVQLFEEMCQGRVQPNEMTFTAVLCACVNAGLVEKGREFFKLMVYDYCLEPNIYHYGCMVDLYAKAGWLEDAYEVIKTMKVEPNVIIWTSLLTACKKFKNLEIAAEGIEKALALEISDENAGLYMLISDLFAMSGRWDDMMKVRNLMDEHNVQKKRGLSSIKVYDPLPRICDQL